MAKKFQKVARFGILYTVVNWPKSGTFLPFLGACTLSQSGKKWHNCATLGILYTVVNWPQKWHVCATFRNLYTLSKLPKCIKKWHICATCGILYTVVNWPKSGRFVPLLGTCTLCQSGQKVSKSGTLCHFWEFAHCVKVAKKWHVCATFGNLYTLSK